jgi:hypothetical protein
MLFTVYEQHLLTDIPRCCLFSFSRVHFRRVCVFALPHSHIFLHFAFAYILLLHYYFAILGRTTVVPEVVIFERVAVAVVRDDLQHTDFVCYGARRVVALHVIAASRRGKATTLCQTWISFSLTFLRCLFCIPAAFVAVYAVWLFTVYRIRLLFFVASVTVLVLLCRFCRSSMLVSTVPLLDGRRALAAIPGWFAAGHYQRFPSSRRTVRSCRCCVGKHCV